MRTNFETVALEVEKLITKMVSAVEPKAIHYWHEQYLMFLEANGWTEKEFDDTLLKSINSNWTEKHTEN